MKGPRSLVPLGLALACAAITFSVAVPVQAQTVTFLYQFKGTQASATSLIQGTDGNFYGTAGGGANNQGQVFRMTPTGKLTTVYSFCSQPNCTDGAAPNSAPILGSDGDFYGVTGAGGSDAGFYSGSGIIYKMTPAGEITTLHIFCATLPCNDGQGPTAVIQASDGNFYGTTVVGGAFGEGTIFEISSAGEFKLLHSFCSVGVNCTDGERPYFPPIQGIDGNFYGAAYGGGTQGGGVFYELTAAGAYRVLYNFCGFSTGDCSAGSGANTIVQDANGNFFGTTAFGGPDDEGTIFEITSGGRYIVLHSFDGVDGENPTQGLTLANDGNLYGLTQGGGVGQDGNIFEITPAGEFASLYSFKPKGYDPFGGPLFEGTNGNLYGTTSYSAGACCYGTIFSLSNGIGPLVETVPGAGPVGQTVLILGNGLTGSTSVTFNGVDAEFTVESDTYIKASVPKGATTGTVSVVTPSGTLKSNPQFVVTK